MVYVINAMTSWIRSWKRDNWKNKVKNRDLFMMLDEISSSRSGKISYVSYEVFARIGILFLDTC